MVVELLLIASALMAFSGVKYEYGWRKNLDITFFAFVPYFMISLLFEGGLLLMTANVYLGTLPTLNSPIPYFGTVGGALAYMTIITFFSALCITTYLVYRALEQYSALTKKKFGRTNVY